MRVVSVQSKVAQAHKQMEMLRQAADGGIQVARMVVMNYLAARQDLPPLDDIYLDNGIKVVGEAMMAYVIAGSCMEKFGGDSIRELEARYNDYRTYIEKVWKWKKI